LKGKNLVPIVVILALTGCTTLTNRTDSLRYPSERTNQATGLNHEPEELSDPANVSSQPLTEVQQKLVDGANQFLGATTLKVGNQTFRMDCSGVISAIYARAGIDLLSSLSRYTGNGVARLYKFLDENDLLYRTTDPAPGDIIFWDNTWDANGDGEFNDYFTHVGMVVNRLPDGTVEYIHHHYTRGVVLEWMNLHQPDIRYVERDGESVKINSAIRARSAPAAPEGISLASQLYRHLGKAWELEDK